MATRPAKKQKPKAFVPLAPATRGTATTKVAAIPEAAKPAAPVPAHKTKTDRAAEEAQRKAVIDEYGQLDAELAPVKHRIRRFEELAKTIRGWHADTAPELTIIERGDRFHVVVGPKAETTLFAAAQQIYDLLGHDKFLAIAKVTLGGLESELTAEEVATLTHKERTGSRSLKPVPAPGV